MPVALRTYLESIGLGKDASKRAAWSFYHKLEGAQRSRARTLRRENRQDPPASDPGNNSNPTNRSAPPNTTPAPAAGNPDRETILRQERDRQTAIRHLAGDDISREMVDRAINEGWTSEQAGEAFLRQMRTNREPPVSAPAGHTRSHDRDCTLAVLQAAFMLRNSLELDRDVYRGQRAHAVGLPAWLTRGTEADESQRTMELAHRYADMSAVDLCREALRLDQRNVPSSRRETIRAAVSGASLQYIFTTSVQARLLTSYMQVGDTTAGWCMESDVPNYLLQDRHQLGKTADLEQVPEGHTADHADISDTKESFRIARYGKKFTVDEIAIINDNLNAISRMPAEFGDAAARLRPALVYGILISNPLMSDGKALFHVDHGNLDTSAGLADATLQAALTALSTQQQDGVPLGLFGQYLITPRALRFTAAKLIRSQETRDTTANTEYGTYNPLQDENLELRSDQRLDNGVYDPSSKTTLGGSTTDWYLAATEGRHTIEVAYLIGSGRMPMIRSYQLSQGQWGYGWDVELSIGAKALDYRGLHKSEG